MTFRSFITTIFLSISYITYAQTPKERYEEFRKAAVKEYASFREKCNREYVEFLKSSWDWYEGKTPIVAPVEPNPLPPIPYLVPKPHDEEQKPDEEEKSYDDKKSNLDEEERRKLHNDGRENDEENKEVIEHKPVVINPIKEEKQPVPVEPIYEVPILNDDYFSLNFYGVTCKVRLPGFIKNTVSEVSADALAKGWETLSSPELDNAIRDCLEMRIRYGLCDWAYLRMLDQLSREFCDNENSATLLMAYLFSQSGYQMRLANDNGRLKMLFGSKHRIYNHPYFVMEDTNFYPYGNVSGRVSICQGSFKGELPMSLTIPNEQKIGMGLSGKRHIRSEKYGAVQGESQVYKELIDFYNAFPSSEIDGNFMTRWAMYANTPLSQKTKDVLYASLLEAIKGDSKVMAAQKLLNWVQTGFEYEYDDKVWGQDRAFFAEETLYYPYSDCEDRSILFSRLVRDLLGLDVALIYYPGHLATAVCFNEDTGGNAMIIDRKKFIICDPTYIGAPVGAQMPGLEYDKAQAIILNR